MPWNPKPNLYRIISGYGYWTKYKVYIALKMMPWNPKSNLYRIISGYGYWTKYKVYTIVINWYYYINQNCNLSLFVATYMKMCLSFTWVGCKRCKRIILSIACSIEFNQVTLFHHAKIQYTKLCFLFQKVSLILHYATPLLQDISTETSESTDKW